MGVPLSRDSLIWVTLSAQGHSVPQIGHLTGNLSRRSVTAVRSHNWMQQFYSWPA